MGAIKIICYQSEGRTGKLVEGRRCTSTQYGQNYDYDYEMECRGSIHA